MPKAHVRLYPRVRAKTWRSKGFSTAVNSVWCDVFARQSSCLLPPAVAVFRAHAYVDLWMVSYATYLVMWYGQRTTGNNVLRSVVYTSVAVHSCSASQPSAWGIIRLPPCGGAMGSSGSTALRFLPPLSPRRCRCLSFGWAFYRHCRHACCVIGSKHA